jgi:hypothetical protein
MAGYSGTPLVQKLGIKPGFRILLVDAPNNFVELIGGLPDDVNLCVDGGGPFDMVLLFSKEASHFAARFPELLADIGPKGMIWAAWPKRASKVPTDLTFDVVQPIGLATGWVDVKVCAIDEIWTGLKFLRRRGQS